MRALDASTKLTVLTALLALRCGDGNAAAAKDPASTPADLSDASALQDATAAPVECTVQAPNACPDPAVHFGDIEPIIEQRCAAPCHSGTADGPWPLRGYEHVADWEDNIRSEVLRCTMPPPDAGVPITNEERRAILEWIRCGFRP